MQATVLVATTRRWFPTARLAMALANAGCNVEAVCPVRHALGNTAAVNRIHAYHGLTPLMSFTAAIAAAKPDLVIPGDDLATCHLHQLHSKAQQDDGKSSALCALIERSLGAAESFPVVYARSSFIQVAQEEGVRAPKTEVVANPRALKTFTTQTGFPVVLKANGTSGGDGVRVVRTMEEAERAFHALQAPPLLARAVKRALVNQDQALVWPSLLRRRSVVNAQAFVSGREATSTVACWKGTVLAGIHCEVINKADLSGHATVVRVVDNAEMSAAAEAVVRRLNLSGLHGFDFMLEADTGNAHLIEINPRATQVGHLSLGPERDLPAALYAAMCGQTPQAVPKVTEKDTIALFPQEWIRDPASPFLQSGYHDVPWEEPELIRMCVRQRRKQSAWYSPKGRLEALSPVRLPRQ